MSDDRQFLDRVGRELDRQVGEQSPALQGRLRALRREVLEGGRRPAERRHWLPALAASFFLVIAISALWFQPIEDPESGSGLLIQVASSVDMQMLNAGDDIELYQNLEFYYWLQQEQADAG